jgi:hypothetical protein
MQRHQEGPPVTNLNTFVASAVYTRKHNILLTIPFPLVCERARSLNPCPTARRILARLCVPEYTSVGFQLLRVLTAIGLLIKLPIQNNIMDYNKLRAMKKVLEISPKNILSFSVNTYH